MIEITGIRRNTASPIVALQLIHLTALSTDPDRDETIVLENPFA